MSALFTNTDDWRAERHLTQSAGFFAQHIKPFKVLPYSTMRQIGVRELRQNASAWLREVQGGASFEITDRGRPVALLVPLPADNVIERLAREGRLKRATRDFRNLPPPLPAIPGQLLPSETLEQMRADER